MICRRRVRLCSTCNGELGAKAILCRGGALKDGLRQWLFLNRRAKCDVGFAVILSHRIKSRHSVVKVISPPNSSVFLEIPAYEIPVS